MIIKSKPRVPLKNLLSGVAMLPSTGEQVYSTTVHTYTNSGGDSVELNRHSSGAADFTKSIAHMRKRLPKMKWVSLIVSWFGNDLRIGNCTVRPKVENNTGVSSPNDWRVSSQGRATAAVPSLVGGNLAYGATPSDNSVIEGIRHMRSRGLKVMFYPFILMDIPAVNGLPDPYGGAQQAAHPWRGRITMMPGQDNTAAVTTAVDSFFGTCTPAHFTRTGTGVNYSGPNEWSYRRMILHYANLCRVAGGVQAFCIGSEMRGLTQARSARTVFPAVAKLRTLAAEVRAILGAGTEISYASDWTEVAPYQPQDGTGDILHPLDPLWMDTNIDFVGIDNYIPISDWRPGPHGDLTAFGSIYNTAYLRANIEGGEGYDWYYQNPTDRANRIRTALDRSYDLGWQYCWKDHKSWWNSQHRQRLGYEYPGTLTSWVPQSKRIVYTEYGCAAIQYGTNEPNKFLDPKSSESVVPHFSNGTRDDKMQQKYYEAMTTYWQPSAGHNPVSTVTGERMIDTTMMFAWAWDGRPWPHFPRRTDVWSDGDNYAAGHWLMGRRWIEE